MAHPAYVQLESKEDEVKDDVESSTTSNDENMDKNEEKNMDKNEEKNMDKNDEKLDSKETNLDLTEWSLTLKSLF